VRREKQMVRIYFRMLHAIDEDNDAYYDIIPSVEIEDGYVEVVYTPDGRISMIRLPPWRDGSRGYIMVIDPPIHRCFKQLMLDLFDNLTMLWEDIRHTNTCSTLLRYLQMDMDDCEFELEVELDFKPVGMTLSDYTIKTLRFRPHKPHT